MERKELKKLSGIVHHDDYVEDYYKYEVAVDGEKLIDCIFADVENGRAFTLVRGEDGTFLQNKINSGPQTKEHNGTVTITRTSQPITERYSPTFLQVFGKHFTVVQ